MRTTWLPILLLSISDVQGRPNRGEEALRELQDTRYHYLAERWCANPCGSAGLCCGSYQSCITSNGQFQCSDAPPSSNVQAQVAQTSSAAAAAISGINCDLSLGEHPCMTICCAAGQKCGYPGQCVADNNAAGLSSSIFVFVSTATANPNTAPLRPTSEATATTTATSKASKTTTMGYMTPSAASTSGSAVNISQTSSNPGLSAGAIAGIVIGVLAGIFIFFLICAFLCCRGIIDGILGFFGLRNRRRTEVTEERYSRHGGSTTEYKRTWYGVRRPVRVDVVEKKKSGFGGMTAVTAGLATLAVGLGLKRRHDRKKEERIERRSSYSYSYDSDSYTSESSASTPPRSQRISDSRRSRR